MCVCVPTCAVQVVSGGGERKTISDDEDIYSDQQKLPRRVANKVQVSFLSKLLSLPCNNYCMVCTYSETEKVPQCEQVTIELLCVCLSQC